MSQNAEVLRRAPLVRLRKQLQNELIPATRSFINEASTTPPYYFVLLAERIRTQILQPARALEDEPSRDAAGKIIDDAETCIGELEAASQAAHGQAEEVEPSVAGGEGDNIPSRRSEVAGEGESDAIAMQRFIADLFPHGREAGVAQLNTNPKPAMQQGPRVRGRQMGNPTALPRLGGLSSYTNLPRPAMQPVNPVEYPHWKQGMTQQERANFKHWLDTRPVQIPHVNRTDRIPMFVRSTLLQHWRPIGNFHFKYHSNIKRAGSSPGSSIISSTLSDDSSVSSRSPVCLTTFTSFPPPNLGSLSASPLAFESVHGPRSMDTASNANSSLDNASNSNSSVDGASAVMSSTDISSNDLGEHATNDKVAAMGMAFLSSDVLARFIIYGIIFAFLRLPAVAIWHFILQLLEALATGKSHSTLYVALIALAICKNGGMDPANSLLVLLATAFVPLGHYWILDGLAVLGTWAWYRQRVTNFVAEWGAMLRWRDVLSLFAMLWIAYGG